MRINFKKSDEIVNICKAMASANKREAEAGREAFGAFVGPVADVVFQQANLIDGIYRTESFRFDEDPSIPIPPYYANTEGLFDIWSNSVDGGLAYNEVYGQEDYRFRLFRIDSAIAFNRRYLANARLNQLALGIERLLQEILVKRNYFAWQPLLSALGGARTNGAPHLIASYAKTNSLTRNLQVADFSRLQTFYDRLRPSWVGGTVDGNVSGITDIFLSPEGFEYLRAFAYNPMNTDPGPTSTIGTEVGSTVGIPLPDSMREQAFKGGATGRFEFMGVTFHKLLELGPNKPFTLLLDTYYTPVGSEPTFNGATEDVMIAINRNADSFWRATSVDDGGSQFVLEEDDQFTRRENKVGWFGFIEEGYTVLDARSITGLIF